MSIFGTLAEDAGTVDPAPTESAPRASSFAVDGACRALDIVVAVILLVPLIPVMLVIATVIRIDSHGPALFRQRRLGRDLRPFIVNKFRTMTTDASEDVHRAFVLGLIAGDSPAGADGEPRFKLAADRRVTRVGKLLRRSSLDELPQLWNVVCGQMSLVGPRPAIHYEVEHYPADWFGRFAVKPGLTGLWQVSGRSELSVQEMIRLDLEYAERRSFLLNVRILLRTVPTVLSFRGAS
jgi:lipopolysaccharide/colanic/teichoic acid biosynthesis glycosyltransferase